jgi:hypothetical protein
MKKRPFILFALVMTFVLIGTANADWIVQTISTSPVIPEHLGLITLGATMVALAAYGRARLTRPSSKSNN